MKGHKHVMCVSLVICFLQSDVSTADPLIHDIGKAIENLKPKLAVGIRTRTDVQFRKLQEGIGKVRI